MHDCTRLYTYVGAPVTCDGVVVGSMCGGWVGPSPVPPHILERIEREARRVSVAFEREVHERTWRAVRSGARCRSV